MYVEKKTKIKVTWNDSDSIETAYVHVLNSKYNTKNTHYGLCPWEVISNYSEIISILQEYEKHKADEKYYAECQKTAKEIQLKYSKERSSND